MTDDVRRITGTAPRAITGERSAPVPSLTHQEGSIKETPFPEHLTDCRESLPTGEEESVFGGVGSVCSSMCV